MTSMEQCPDCGTGLLSGSTITDLAGVGVPWKCCPLCGWNERRQLMEKMDEERQNSPDP